VGFECRSIGGNEKVNDGKSPLFGNEQDGIPSAAAGSLFSCAPGYGGSHRSYVMSVTAPGFDIKRGP
jgi:hypothetical protein